MQAGYRTGGMQEWAGGMQDWIQDRWDAGLDRYRTGGMQDWIDTLQRGCRTG